MLRTTNKTVKTALTAHVLANFLPVNYGSDPKTTDALGNLREQMRSIMTGTPDAMRYNNRSIYQTALDYVEGGSMLVYYGDCRDFLKMILEQTDDESNRYSDEKVWRLYCHLVARTMANLYTKGK